MSSSDSPLSPKNILAGIIITVIGGVILAYLIQEGRFAPGTVASQTTPSTSPSARAEQQATNTPSPTPTPSPSPTPEPSPPTPTPQPPTPTSIPTQTPTPTCGAGCVLYEADWSSGMNGWAGSREWKAGAGMLVNDGTGPIISPGSVVMAPYKPGSEGIADYAVEVEMQLVREGGTCNTTFGIFVRKNQEGGYFAGLNPHCTKAYITNWRVNIAEQTFSPGTDWHTYRLEVQGLTIRLFVDGGLLVETTDSQFLEGGEAGLHSGGSVLNVRSFKIIKL